jgi:hypothetical protein
MGEEFNTYLSQIWHFVKGATLSISPTNKPVIQSISVY